MVAAALLSAWLCTAGAATGSVLTPPELAEAERLYAQSDYEASLASARSVVSEHPSAMGYFIIGSCESRLSQWRQAKKDLQHALDLDPGFSRPGLHYRLGYVILNEELEGDVDVTSPRLLRKALEQFEAELRLVPDFAPALAAKALTLDRLKRRSEAIQVTRAWLQTDPASIDAHAMMIIRLAANGAIDDALLAMEAFPATECERLPGIVLSALRSLRFKQAKPLLRRSLELQTPERAATLARVQSLRDCALADYLATEPPLDEALVVGRLANESDSIETAAYELEDCGITPPVAKHKVNPDYPETARARRLNGRVTFQCILGADGRIKGMLVIQSSSGIFETAALEAMKQWTYEPATREGKPLPIYFTATVDFTIN